MTCAHEPGHGFSGLVVTEGQRDGLHDRLMEALSYTTADGAWEIVAPAWFLTDYASIPRLLWAVIPPRGRYNRAAIIHDLLYQRAPRDPQTHARCTRARADAVMYEACQELGVRLTQRWVIWAGLRFGGWLIWRRYRRQAGQDS